MRKRARQLLLARDDVQKITAPNRVERGLLIKERGRWIVMPLCWAALPDGSISVVLAEEPVVVHDATVLPDLAVEAGPVDERVLESLGGYR